MTAVLDLSPPLALALPPPISVNNLFFNLPKGGRAKTAKYKAWRKDAEQYLECQIRAIKFSDPFPVSVCIKYLLGEVGCAIRDCGNCEKALTDALVDAQVIHDDSRKYVKDISLRWVGGLSGTIAYICPASDGIDASAFHGLLTKPGRQLIKVAPGGELFNAR